MLTIEYAKDPHYNTQDNLVIGLTVKFAEFSEELPFGATAHDEMAHGQILYQRALAGDFGEIAPYAGEIIEQPISTGSQTL